MILGSVLPVRSAGFKAGLSVSYHAVSDGLFKSIYGPGGPIPAVSLAIGLKRFELRAEAGYFGATGAMTESGEDLRFKMVSFLFGARYEILKKAIRPYVGLGLGSMRFDEDYPERFEDVSGSSTITYAEAGTFFSLLKNIRLDASIRWSRAMAKSLNRENINLGGLMFGIGAGYAF